MKEPRGREGGADVKVGRGAQAGDGPQPSEKGRQMNQFVIGEYVERKIDGAVGVVKKINEYEGETHYVVDLGREPLEGQEDDCWLGTEQAWRRHLRTHAHVETNSRDCDGDYQKGHVDVPSTLERCSQFGETDFKERVMVSIVSLHTDGGALAVKPEGLEWMEHTEEGYVATTVEWCEREDCERRFYQRDFRAEAAGY